jgi:hypothetical protein
VEKFVYAVTRLSFYLPERSQKFRKPAVSFNMPGRPSVRMEQLGSYWTNFHKIWNLQVVRKSVMKTEVSLKSDENHGYFR